MALSQNSLSTRTAAVQTALRTRLEPWKAALTWGTSLALLHRIVLMTWAAAVWLAADPYIDLTPDLHMAGESKLVALEPRALSVTLGVWRRWDATHYLDLAANGYQADNPGPTVFGVLTPLSFYAADRVLPGPVDAAAAVVETLAFMAALTLLYRLVDVTFDDSALAQSTVLLTVLTPISYFFAAPISESLYLACVLLFFYAAFQGRWLEAGGGGLLATMARAQGAALAGIGSIILLQQTWKRSDTMSANLRRAIRTGWPLLVIPPGYVAFLVYRQMQGLPPLIDVYHTESYLFFTDPLSGLYWTLRHLYHHPQVLLTEADFQAIPLYFGLAVWSVVDERHRRLPLVLYTWGYLLLFLTKVNWERGTDTITYAQSVARYGLALFPLTILAADRVLNRVTPSTRRWMLLGLFGLLLLTTARHVFYLAGP